MISTEGHGHAFDQDLVAEFRANQGRVTGTYANSPLAVLTTMGARSGQPRATPLGYSRDGNRVIVIASNDGKSTHPAWYHNLIANPRATIELPGETIEVRSRVAEGAERDRLFALMATEMPDFTEYQRATTREIPVVILEPAAG